MSLEPKFTCRKCSRLAKFRKENQKAYPDWHNGPVASIGPLTASLLVVGLAPGLKGANKSGVPFSGDGSGDLLYQNLVQQGFANGQYRDHDALSIELLDVRVTNAVRCVPPENKPLGSESKNCLPFLSREIGAMPNLKAILCLGSVAHSKTLAVFGLPQSAAKFGHLAKKDLGNGLQLYDSYHCSRYNLNTGRLTEEMFAQVFSQIKEDIHH